MRVYNSIAVKHNIEVAHRLFELPGKCEQIHGHSMWVTMELEGDLNGHGILAGIEFGDLKKSFRGYLDETYDHRLLLNVADPFSKTLCVPEYIEKGERHKPVQLPGLMATPGDPTTENIAKWIAEHMESVFSEAGTFQNLAAMKVTVWETSVNMANHVRDYEVDW